MSYTGNSKEAIQQLAGVDVVITNLQSDLTSETNSRIDAVASLRDDLNSEVGNREAQSAVLNMIIISKEMSIYNYVASELANESNTRMTGDATIQDSLNGLSISTDSRFVAASNRLTTLETGLTAQVNEMISNNALDVVQSNLISQYAASLSEADSVIYERIAEKSGLIAVNAFRTKFNSYLNDWFGAYTLNINNVAKTAADYQIPAEVSVNQNPNL